MIELTTWWLNGISPINDSVCKGTLSEHGKTSGIPKGVKSGRPEHVERVLDRTFAKIRGTYDLLNSLRCRSTTELTCRFRVSGFRGVPGVRIVEILTGTYMACQ